MDIIEEKTEELLNALVNTMSDGHRVIWAIGNYPDEDKEKLGNHILSLVNEIISLKKSEKKPSENDIVYSPDKWAQHEVENLIAHTKNEYIAECAKSALRAYNSVYKDGHSGNSIGIMRGMLNDLIRTRPLTPLTGEDDEWSECGMDDVSGVKTFQNKRYGALFKDVSPDGTVKYNDVDRFVCYQSSNPNIPFTNGFVARTVAAMDGIPQIEFPYMPLENPMRIEVEEILTDFHNGDFDGIGIESIQFVDKNEIHGSRLIGRYFDLSDTGRREITKTEWIDKKKTSDELKTKFDDVSRELMEKHPGWKGTAIEREAKIIASGDKHLFDPKDEYVPTRGGFCGVCGGCGGGD